MTDIQQTINSVRAMVDELDREREEERKHREQASLKWEMGATALFLIGAVLTIFGNTGVLC